MAGGREREYRQTRLKSQHISSQEQDNFRAFFIWIYGDRDLVGFLKREKLFQYVKVS
jgi:hypothetical protein